MEPQTQLQLLNARIQDYYVYIVTVFYYVEHRYRQEDTRAWQSLMETVTLILPFVWLYAQGIDDDNGGTWQIKMEPRNQLQNINARIQAY